MIISGMELIVTEKTRELDEYVQLNRKKGRSAPNTTEVDDRSKAFDGPAGRGSEVGSLRKTTEVKLGSQGRPARSQHSSDCVSAVSQIYLELRDEEVLEL